MRNKVIARSYDQFLQLLRGAQFDVQNAPAVAGDRGVDPSLRPILVTKYGAGAVLAENPILARTSPPKGYDRSPEERLPVVWLEHPGWLLGGQVATLLDRGHQKFFTTPKLTVAATADGLKAIHRFSEELREIIGEPSLYNESLGTVSNSYLYDRVKDRDLPPAQRPLPAWELPAKAWEPPAKK
jgi:hypothetical protein